jgi:hypothetical protein
MAPFIVWEIEEINKHHGALHLKKIIDYTLQT